MLQTPFYPPLCHQPVCPADVPKPVMTVNGRKPDEHGNVDVEGGGGGGGGDVRHSDFADMQPGGEMDLDTVNSKVDTLIRKLKGTASVAFALLSVPLFAALGPTTRFGKVPPDATLREIVEAGGGVAPTKLSDLTNDVGYVTRTVTNGLAKLTDLPAKVGELTNDVGYVTETVTNGLAKLTDLSAKVGDLTNDVGYVTETVTNGLAKLTDLPAKVGELTNDVGYVTEAVTNGLASTNFVVTGVRLGFAVGARRFPTIADALRAIAGSSGEAVISAYESFSLSGREDWTGISADTVRVRGMAPVRGVRLEFTGPANGILFPLGAGGTSSRRVVFENVTVEAPQGTVACRLELQDVKWVGPLSVRWPAANRNAKADEPFAVVMRRVDLDAAGGKYAVDVTIASVGGDLFEDCVFSGFSRGAADFVYHRCNVEFRRCVFDGSSVTRADTVGLVNLQGGSGSFGPAVFESCVFKNLRREVGGRVVGGPAIADRVGDGQMGAGRLVLKDNVFEDTVAYVLAFGDPFEGRPSTHLHFNVTGSGNVWRNYSAATGFGTKMSVIPDERGFYTGVGYVGDAPQTGEVVELPWEGTAAQGAYGFVGRGCLADADIPQVEVPVVLSAFSNDVGYVTSSVTNGLVSTNALANIATNAYTKAEADENATARANAAIAAAGCVRTNANGLIDLHGSIPGIRMGTSEYNEGSIYDLNYGLLYFPWGSGYGQDPSHDFATRADVPDVSGFVPYTGATNDVDIGEHYYNTRYGYSVNPVDGSWDETTQYCHGFLFVSEGSGLPGYKMFFPWAFEYYDLDTPSYRKFALVSQIEDATNGLFRARYNADHTCIATNLCNLMADRLSPTNAQFKASVTDIVKDILRTAVKVRQVGDEFQLVIETEE